MNGPEWPVFIDPEVYLAQMGDIRENGYATSYEEHEPGAAAVSVTDYGSQEAISLLHFRVSGIR